MGITTPLFTSYSRRTKMTKMTKMISIPALLLLVVQEPFVNSMPTACCAAKTVGEYSYTLVDSPESFPAECQKACAYTRDGQEGSLYCFAPGPLPVHCKGEMPVSLLGPTYGPFGNLPGGTDMFNDSDATQGQNIIGLSMWTNNVAGNDVVAGIQMVYGGIEGLPHGDTTGTKKECPRLPNEQGNRRQYTRITITSLENNVQNPDQNQIYSLRFEVQLPNGQVESQYTCEAGSPNVGITTVIPDAEKGGNYPDYIFGKVLTAGGALQSLNFVFKNI